MQASSFVLISSKSYAAQHCILLEFLFVSDNMEMYWTVSYLE